MKRMSEVFGLPVSSHYKFLNNADETLMISQFDSASEAQHAAHAINHVDALADALGDIVFDYFATINLSNIDMATLNPELHKKMTVATDALAAYRGYK